MHQHLSFETCDFPGDPSLTFHLLIHSQNNHGEWPEGCIPPPRNTFLPRIADSTGVGQQTPQNKHFARLCFQLKGLNTLHLPTTCVQEKKQIRFFFKLHFPGHLWMDDAILSKLGILSGKEPCLQFCNWTSKKLIKELVKAKLLKEDQLLGEDFEFFMRCIFGDVWPMFHHNKSKAQFPWDNELMDLAVFITKDLMDHCHLTQLKSVGLGPLLP